MNMLKNEWKQIIKDRKMLLAICGILLVPFLYSVIFLAANWNPYNNTENLPVAVVNNDEGTEWEGKELRIGDDFVDNLKDNDSFDWQFVDEAEAMDGLKSEDYYMVVELPEDFSANAATLLDDNPEKMEIEYYSNPGKNYPASKITDSAMQSLDKEIGSQVSKEYANSVFASLTDVAEGLQDASNGSKELADGAEEINEGAANLSENLQTLASGTITFTEGVNAANTGANELNDGINELAENTPALQEGASEVSRALNQLNENSTDLTDGSEQLISGEEELTNGLAQLQDATSQLASKFPALNDGITALNEQAQDSRAQLAEAREQLEQLSSLASEFQQEEQEAQTAAQEQSEQIAQLIASSDLSDEQKETLNAQMAEVIGADSSAELPEINAEDIQNQLDSLDSQLAQIQELADGAAETESALNAINEATQDLYTGSSDLLDGQKELNTGITAYTSAVNQLDNGAAQVADGVNSAAAGVTAIQSGSNQLTTGLDTLADSGTQLADGSSQASEGSQTLSDGTQELADGNSTLYNELSEGAADAQINTTDKTDDMFASPTDVQEEKISNVHTYGEGLAPYIISIGLFVGALVFTNIFPLRAPTARPNSGISWFISKFSVVVFVSLLQSVIADIVLIRIVGLEVHSDWRFFVFTFLFSITSFLLIQFLTVALDNVGRFLGIIALLLQIGGSAGTYPVALLPEFFQKIHPYIPMTYAISGFREIISIGDDWGFLWEQAGYLVLFSMLFLVLTILVYTLQARKLAKSETADSADISS